MNIKLSNIKALWINKPLIRVYFLLSVLIPVPVGLFVTSFFFRIPRVNQIKEGKMEVLPLRSEVGRLKLSWSEDEEKLARANLEDVRGKIPGSYEDVLDWVKDLTSLMSSKGFDMGYTLGGLKTAYDGVKGLSTLPVHVNLRAGGAVENQEVTTASRLNVFLGTLKDIIENHYGFDLVGLTVLGAGDGVSEINVDFTLCVGFTN
ncbi:MAG: hypothetical protein ACUZ8E_09880 [Candidatus Anammoxibacter sp.]